MSTIGSATGEVPVMQDQRSHLERITDPFPIVPRRNRIAPPESQETDMVEKNAAFRTQCLQMASGIVGKASVDDTLRAARRIEAYLCGEEDPDVTAARVEAEAKAAEAEAKKASKSKDG